MASLKEQLLKFFPSGRYPGDRILQRKYPVLVQELQLKIKEDISLRAKFELVLKDLVAPIKCPNCSKPVRWAERSGWMTHCSRNCASSQAAKNPRILEKKRQTCLERYGADHWTRTEEFRKRFKGKKRKIKIHKLTLEQRQAAKLKYQATCQERYGVTNAAQLAEVKSKISAVLLALTPEQKRQKLRRFETTNLDRHGVAYPMQSKKVQAKAQETSLSHYGVAHPAQAASVQTKMSESLSSAWIFILFSLSF